jgi:hypothetical protein
MYFHATTVKSPSSMQNLLFTYQELFVNDPFDVKENDERALDFASHLTCLFWSQ